MSKFAVTWHFADGSKLTRLLPAKDEATARKMAESPSYQRGIFRRAGKVQRHPTSSHEYMDKFPTPTKIVVKKSAYA